MPLILYALTQLIPSLVFLFKEKKRLLSQSQEPLPVSSWLWMYKEDDLTVLDFL